jgi:hypothetical protein
MVAPMKKKSLVIDDVDPDAKFPVPVEGDFIIEEEERDFLRHQELARIGEALIERRGAFSDLKNCRVIFLFKKEGGKSKGTLTLGRCLKPSGLLSYFSRTDFIIWAAADHCRLYQFTYWQIEALLFHELKHAVVERKADEDRKLSLKPHDWEGFVDEIRFYGAWRSSIERLREVFQPTLFDSIHK